MKPKKMSQRAYQAIAALIGVGLLVALGFSLNALFVSRFQQPPRPASQSKTGSQYWVRVQRQSPTIANPTSLLEAWSIISVHGQQWREDARIARLRSTDVNDPTPSQAGDDGRRSTWQAILISSTGNRPQLWVRITDGVVVDSIQQPADPRLTPIVEKPALDSTDVITKVIAEKPRFTYGKGKAKGFHFSLVTEGDAVVFRVHGSYQGQPAVVEVDARTGKLIASRYLTTEPSGGILYSPDAGVTWLASDLIGEVAAITPDSGHRDHAYAIVAVGDRLVLYQSGDGGAHWSLIARLPREAGSWAFDILAVTKSANRSILLVGTENGLWVSEDGGTTWIRSTGLPAGPAQWLDAVGTGPEARALVSITAGPNAGLYMSADLSRWKRKEEGVYRLSHSYNRRAVLAINERAPGRGLVLEHETSYSVSLPPDVLRVGGALDGSAPLVAESPGEIKVRVDEKGGWRNALRADLVSLAAAPDFPTSGVVVAGGFRSGIYRSADGGKTWEVVLDDPSSLVPGNGEVARAEFLSATHVIALNGGDSTWKSFYLR